VDGKTRIDTRGQDTYFIPILEALRFLGGQGTTDQIQPMIWDRTHRLFAEYDLRPLDDRGQPRWWNHARWARKKLIEGGYLQAGMPRGQWALATGVERRGNTWVTPRMLELERAMGSEADCRMLVERLIARNGRNRTAAFLGLTTDGLACWERMLGL